MLKCFFPDIFLHELIERVKLQKKLKLSTLQLLFGLYYSTFGVTCVFIFIEKNIYFSFRCKSFQLFTSLFIETRIKCLKSFVKCKSHENFKMNSSQFNNYILTLSDKLFRLARSILKNETEAEDAVQELNLKLWEKRHQLEGIDNVQAFAMRSMRNLCIDMVRQQKYTDEVQHDIIYDAPDPYLQTEQMDMVSRIRIMIDKLPELQRTIIRLRDVEGIEMSEISLITGVSLNAATVNLSRARQKIREQIMLETQKVDEKIWKI